MNKLLRAALILTLLSFTGCATSKTTVGLLHEDGKNSSIVVTTKGGSQVIDKEDNFVSVDSENKAPDKPVKLEPNEIKDKFGTALNVLPFPPVKYILHFKQGSDELTDESLQLLPQIMETAKKRDPVDISIIGHTDTVGTKEYNYKLSYNRAMTVANYLINAGIDKKYLQIKSHGKEDPLIPTGDNVNEPRNRRVEVIVR